jgi:hypothetical protein
MSTKIGTFGDEGFEIVTAVNMGTVKTDEMFVATAIFDYSYAAKVVPQPSMARKSARLPLTLPRSAKLDSLTVVVGAAPAQRANLNAVAQVRIERLPSNAGTSVFIDFGTPVTVSGLRFPISLELAGMVVYPWTGTAFALWHSPGFPRVNNPDVGSQDWVFEGEVLTERLRVDIGAELSDVGAIASQWQVLLPQGPSDLELALADGTRLWSWPGPVPKGASATAPVGQFNSAFFANVDVTAPLAALCGDPSAPHDDARVVELVLTTRTAGILSLAEGARTAFTLHRPLLAGAAESALVFEAEGVVDVPVTLPAPPSGKAWSIQKLELTGAGEFAAERTFPAQGPEASPHASVTLNPERAVAIQVPLEQLPSEQRYAALAAIRLPVRAVGGSAEARVMLLTATGQGPGEPVEGGTSEPVVVAEAAQEAWTTFALSSPIQQAAANLWAAVVVSRGALEVKLAQAAPGGPAWLAASALRRGAPKGPWLLLPSGTAALAAARGRVRARGAPTKSPPWHPITVELWQAAGAVVKRGASATFEPSPKGKSLVLAPATPGPVNTAWLRISAFAAGNLTLSGAIITLQAT